MTNKTFLPSSNSYSNTQLDIETAFSLHIRNLIGILLESKGGKLFLARWQQGMCRIDFSVVVNDFRHVGYIQSSKEVFG